MRIMAAFYLALVLLSPSITGDRAFDKGSQINLSQNIDADRGTSTTFQQPSVERQESYVDLAILLGLVACIVGGLITFWNFIHARKHAYGIGDYSAPFWITFVGLGCAWLIALSHPTTAAITAAAAIGLASLTMYYKGDRDLVLALATPLLVAAALIRAVGRFKPRTRSARRSVARKSTFARQKSTRQRLAKMPRPKSLRSPKFPSAKTLRSRSSKQPKAYKITSISKKGVSQSHIYKNGKSTSTSTGGKGSPRHTHSVRNGSTTVTTVTTRKGTRTYRRSSNRSGNHITRIR